MREGVAVEGASLFRPLIGTLCKVCQHGRRLGEHARDRIRTLELKRRHGERRAALRTRPKGDAAKVGLAARLRVETTMTVGWIAEPSGDRQPGLPEPLAVSPDEVRLEVTIIKNRPPIPLSTPYSPLLIARDDMRALQVVFLSERKRACCRSRAWPTRARIASECSSARSLEMSRYSTEGTSMCRSMRSRSGPEMRWR